MTFGTITPCLYALSMPSIYSLEANENQFLCHCCDRFHRWYRLHYQIRRSLLTVHNVIIWHSMAERTETNELNIDKKRWKQCWYSLVNWLLFSDNTMRYTLAQSATIRLIWVAAPIQSMLIMTSKVITGRKTIEEPHRWSQALSARLSDRLRYRQWNCSQYIGA